ncbi:MAG: restriction endonuclease [Opitutaceae bacterium]|jgi:ssDNA-binding Zn-finger/Zn-ribbon topoisomerase 1
MTRYRRKRRAPYDVLDLLPPLAGLLVLGILMVPGFKQLMGAFFALAVAALVVAAIGFVGFAIWRLYRNTSASNECLNPQPLSCGQPPPVIPLGTERTKASEPPQPPSKPVWALEFLRAIEWKRFEELVAAYAHELGYEAKTTRIGPDGGVDVLLFQSDQSKPIMAVQCKAWNSYKVGVKPVRELFGVMAADGVANGAFFTTNEFTNEALKFAVGKNLDLVDGREFLARINQLPAGGCERLLTMAAAGDYTTPTCPRCGIKMVRRTASKGPNQGQSFWGCENYPRCKSTFNIVANE